MLRRSFGRLLHVARPTTMIKNSRQFAQAIFVQLHARDKPNNDTTMDDID